MPEPQPHFVGPAGQSSLTPPDKRGAGLSDRDQVNVWVTSDDPSTKFAPDLQAESGSDEPIGEQPAFSDAAGPPLPIGARGIFPRSLANHLDAAMRVATMPTPPIVGDDFRLLERPEDKLAVGLQQATQDAALADAHATPDAVGGAEPRGASAGPSGPGGITLQSDSARSSGPQLAVEISSAQAPTLEQSHGASHRRNAVGPFGISLVSFGPAPLRGAGSESRLLPGSVLTTRLAEERT